MLYEVITDCQYLAGIDPGPSPDRIHLAKQCRQQARRPDLAKTGDDVPASLRCRPYQGNRLENVLDILGVLHPVIQNCDERVALEQGRITSYNVCYTKLLRHNHGERNPLFRPQLIAALRTRSQ